MLCRALSEMMYLVQFECDALALRVVAVHNRDTAGSAFLYRTEANHETEDTNQTGLDSITFRNQKITKVSY